MKKAMFINSLVAFGMVFFLIGCCDANSSSEQAKKKCTKSCEQSCDKSKKQAVKTYQTKDFYDADGNFVPDKAYQAYYDMMNRFNYPIYKQLKDREMFWVADFAQKDFTNVGMGGIFWHNDQKNNYMGHEIFLLPGQMIVEHAHVPTDNVPAKMETWQVRYGSIYTFSQGGSATDKLPIKLPQSQLDKDGITAFICKELKQGDMASLGELEQTHFMIAGPEGAIVTEYASAHDGAALVFTNKTVKF